MITCNLGRQFRYIVEQLKGLEELPKTESNQVYCLTHTYDKFPRRFYVEAPYSPEVFNAICAYIQYECSEIDECYSIDQTEVIEILVNFYGCKKTKRAKANQVDLYLNWETFCGTNLQTVECLKRNGMDEYFNKYVYEYLKSEGISK